LDEADALCRAARRVLKRLLIDQPLLEVCLSVSGLGSGSGVQLALMDDNRQGRGLPHERRAWLEATLARLRARFGPGAAVTAQRLRQSRRLHLWTYPLGHLLNQPIEVATDGQGTPVRYWQCGRHGQVTQREVRRIQNLWKETEWFWGSASQRT